MSLLTFRPGDSTVWTFAPDDGSGQPVDLAGATARVEINAGPSCFHLQLPQGAEGFDWVMNDDTMPDLRPGTYDTTFRILWPDGLNDRSDFRLKIERGCA